MSASPGPPSSDNRPRSAPGGRGIVILGCTGSIGETTFSVLEGLEGQADHDIRVVGLSAGTRVEGLIKHARRWRPEVVCVAESAAVERVKAELPECEVLCGESGLHELVLRDGVEVVVNGLVGAVGLMPTLAALDAGRDVAMANKEPLVIAGGLVLERARQGGARLLPVDSEPSAMWQCLRGERIEDVSRLILTASGGAFRGRERRELKQVTPEQALHHPTWSMGPKITIDSATLMNKGFEVIEAAWLFSVHVDAVDVVLHRESIVHAMVEFIDGAMLAHMGRTDMALPIQYALTEPGRMPGPLAPLNLAEVGCLHFEAPDLAEFPGLALCYQAGRAGGTVPAALSAANEEAVAAFLAGEIGFLDIHQINERVVADHSRQEADDLDLIMAADAWARQQARSVISTLL